VTVSIQVTINKHHKNLELLFYQKWDKWKAKFSEYTLDTTFMWIMEEFQEKNFDHKKSVESDNTETQ